MPANGWINGEPVIYFSGSALYFSELIPENKPFTRLIALSACETGNGQLFNGEGVFDFDLAFAALGIPASLTKLWSVDNKSSYALTELFYKYLTRGLATDFALQKAKIEFFQTAYRQKTLPYYWAATIFTGKTELLLAPGSSLWKWLVAILIFGLLGIAVRLVIGRRNLILCQPKY